MEIFLVDIITQGNIICLYYTPNWCKYWTKVQKNGSFLKSAIQKNYYLSDRINLGTMYIVEIETQNTKIYIGESYKNIEKYLPQSNPILICDKNIYKYYSNFIHNYRHIVIDCGEEIKNWNTVEYIVSQLIEMGADRNSYLIGMGGGVVCDIVGFVASIYMRGIRFAFISCSLLSQVDASLGGKNGVNFKRLKNMLGVFNPPDFVICDAELLQTLPDREFFSGFGEVIKHALILDTCFFEFLQQNRELLLQKDAGKLVEMVHWAVRLKAKVVTEDPTEKGLRKILNFGHTFGHAIENNSEVTHGEAVAIGMVLACELSHKLNGFPIADIRKIIHLLQQYSLPVATNVKATIIAETMANDKKKNGSNIDFIVLNSIGKADIITMEYKDIIEWFKNRQELLQ